MSLSKPVPIVIGESSFSTEDLGTGDETETLLVGGGVTVKGGPKGNEDKETDEGRSESETEGSQYRGNSITRTEEKNQEKSGMRERD